MQRPKRKLEANGGDYKVGKYKPDPQFNWKKGQSGNPKGRPKGSKNLKTIVRASMRKTVPVNKGGRKRKLTISEVGMHNLEQEVLGRSRSAFLDYWSILERHSDDNETKASMQELLTEDQAILAYMLGRMKRTKTKGEK